MPRGQYNRAEARARREATSMPNDVIGQPPTPVRTSARSVQRDESWGQRTRKVKGAIDYYAMANGLNPPDAVYQWKSYSIYGQEQKERQIVFSENGWSPVPAQRHPQLPSMGDNIVYEGLILMEQPVELYREAREEERRAHLEQMRIGYERIKETPEGQMDRRVGNVSSKNETLYVDAHQE